MAELLHELLLTSADHSPDSSAITYKSDAMNYSVVADSISRVARGLTDAGLQRQARVAIYLPKRTETVIAMFGATKAGGVFVPVNPLLKADQVAHILLDCNVQILITSKDRLRELSSQLEHCHDLRVVVLVDSDIEQSERGNQVHILPWDALLQNSSGGAMHRIIDQDMAGIFYTSGSTGKPKGVVLSHRNMVVGARSVAQYLANRCSDRLLAVLPFSFDYGFSQLSTAFLEGACVTLMEYLFPKDVIDAVERNRITGLAGVPPLWVQLAKHPWSEQASRELRYITNSGGAMPKTTLAQLRSRLPKTRVFLMYGLTEAFRSTYLDPDEVDRRPDSIGKAIPNAEVMVLREDGTPCAPGEPGELVHRGALVSLGYWNDTEKTAERFRQLPRAVSGLTIPEIAVWSGDTVMRDSDGFLYFHGRRDEMIKTSGYRVSPTEVEEAIYATGIVREVVAIGVPHPEIGQSIVVIGVLSPDHSGDGRSERLLEECRKSLPNFMIPGHVEWRESLPLNANGKIDRKLLHSQLQDLFLDGVS